MNIRPLGSRVVIKPDTREEKTASGIFLPEASAEKPDQGVVVAVGPGRMLDSGQRAVIDLHVGDKVLFSRYAGSTFKRDGVEYLVIPEQDVLAVTD